jgi:hypothetical protein
MTKFKDYYCNHCQQKVAPFQLQTARDDNDKQYWIHKTCGKSEIVRKDRAVETKEEPKPKEPKPKPDPKVVESINSFDDLFE